ncbi:MAG TPA: class F sortase [Actinomycetota bacterium]|nr:class F sortase [Actinomycetota bacterium]
MTLPLGRLRRPLVLVASVAALATPALPEPAARRTYARVASPVGAAVTVTPPPAPTPTPVPEIVPTTIEMPSLAVSAPVVPVGIGPDGAMGTPGNAVDVAWWEGVPAGAGNALLAGHKDYNRRQGSFFRLKDLKPGDPVRVTGAQGVLEFKVEWVQQVSAEADAAEMLGDVGGPVLTLITCGGQFDRRIRHYRDRVVARAVLAA